MMEYRCIEYVTVGRFNNEMPALVSEGWRLHTVIAGTGYFTVFLERAKPLEMVVRAVKEAV